MDKRLLNELDEQLEEIRKKQIVTKRILSEVSSEKLLKDILLFLHRNQFRANIKIEESELRFKIEKALRYLYSDLEEFQRLDQANQYSPTHLKAILNSMMGAISKLDVHFENHRIVSGLVEYILNENPNEIKTTVEKFREQSQRILTAIEPLTAAVSEGLIWEYRLLDFDPGRRALFFCTSESKNRLLFLVSYHLYLLAEEIGITSVRGKAQFIHRILPALNSQIGKYFKALGRLDVSANAIQEVFRSKSWVSLQKK
jgi:hypothetical protein